MSARPEQVSVGKTSAIKPFEDASLTYQVLSKPGVLLFPGTSPKNVEFGTCSAISRWAGGLPTYGPIVSTSPLNLAHT